MTRRFSKDHEWIEIDGQTGTVGITDYAQGQLGDITYVEMPDVGRVVAQNESCAMIDAVKVASDVFSPVSGQITEINGALDDEPRLVNDEAEAGGWLYRITLSSADELDSLMDEDSYKAYLDTL